MKAAPVSVVVPVYNEGENVQELAERLGLTLKNRTYELLFVDDHSTDDTAQKLTALKGIYPITISTKQGKKGKAYSLIQGINEAKYETIAIIDGDLQYPPEAIKGMLRHMGAERLDVVVARRRHHENMFRSLMSRTYGLLYKTVVRGLDVDIQSGLKVFKREVFRRVELHPSPWTFDLEFLLQSRNAGYRIGSFDIDFAPRRRGRSNITFVSAAFEIGVDLIKTLVRTPHVVHFSEEEKSKHGAGFYHNGKRYVTHNSVALHQSALRRLSLWQLGGLTFFVVASAVLLVLEWHAALVVFVSALTLLYFLDLLFNLLLIYRSYGDNDNVHVTTAEMKKVTAWPKYTIFCPLYNESDILRQFVRSMKRLDYPKNKLQVMLLLEQDDVVTQRAAKAMKLPKYFKVVVVPHSMPKTKPKACNFGLARATGEYAVIYDAEDMPEPKQLKKAVVAFAKNADKNVGCIQAKLNFYNQRQNVLTRLFTLEYSLWFDLVLSGLQSLGAPIPLGGTSNHFRVADLKSFGGWDPFNVTEDADLGIRLSKKGYTTLILNSTTLEEANSHYGNWMRQRSRWIKGYIQTFFVHNRRVNALTQKRDFVIFQLVIGGKVISALVNPLFWLLTLVYFLTGNVHVAHFVQSLFVPPVFYIGIASLVVGNFLYMYYYMLGAAKRGQYELILYALLVPFYWLMMSVAAYKALKEFIVKPFYWHKTKHGLHLKTKPGAA